MKRILLIALLFGFSFSLRAQMVYDTVSVGSGYANQVWYSLENGITGISPKDNWDIAFDCYGISTSIWINSSTGTRLWLYPGDKSDFSTMDTTGMGSWLELNNADTSWDYGAFNQYQSGLDLGWGSYNPINHSINGDSIYLIQLSNGDYRKIEIQSLISGVYNFRQASLDNAINTSHTLDKANFANENFGYFDLMNGTTVNREPSASEWEITFTQYTTKIFTPAPVAYTVSGILNNLGVKAAEAYPVADPNTYSDYTMHSFSSDINTIGYDWKFFNGTGFSIQDSLVYFVEKANGSIWKLLFTDFGGSATGTYVFGKEEVRVSGLFNQPEEIFIKVYPNPAISSLNIVCDLNSESSATMVELSGKIVKTIRLNPNGLSTNVVDISDLDKGIYLLEVNSENGSTSRKVVIQ